MLPAAGGTFGSLFDDIPARPSTPFPIPMTERRFAVPFDPEYFARRAAEGTTLTPLEAFRLAHRTNLWNGGDSRSGPGSDLEQTRRVRSLLPDLFRRLGVTTLLDLPCGDWHWMAALDLGSIHYIGGDLVPEIVDRNRQEYGRARREFLQLDLTASPLPRADLLLCRDCLVHLSFRDIRLALENLHRSRIPFVLSTTFPGQERNDDVRTGDWRPLNLQAPPFSFPRPRELLSEGCTEAEGRFGDKSLGLWRVAEVPL